MLGGVRRHRLCIVGSFSCGKTSLQTCIRGLPFEPTPRPTIATSVCHVFPTDQRQTVKVVIDDTSGEEKFCGHLTSSFVRHAHCVLICFDLSCRDSFRSACDHWLPWAKSEGCSGATYIAVGLKADNKHMVTRSELQVWTSMNRLEYFQTSAKTGKGLDKLSRHIGTVFTKARPFCMSISLSDEFLFDDDKKEKRGCCFSGIADHCSRRPRPV